MDTSKAQLVERLENILGELVAEFHYLLGDTRLVESMSAKNMRSIAKLDLATYCVTTAYSCLIDEGVINMLDANTNVRASP